MQADKLDKLVAEKITQYETEINNPNLDNIQDDPMNNLQQIFEDYKISDVGRISQMKNLQEELINAISEIRNKHFQREELPQVYIQDELSTVKKSNRFEDFQKQNYLDCKKRFQNRIKVNAAEISPDETHLVSTSINKIFIWDYLSKTLRQQFEIDAQINTFTFFPQSNGVVFGDLRGRIHQIFISDLVVAVTNVFQVHQDEIYFLLIKQNNEIFTCSQDNTIKLTNNKQDQILLTIDYLCPCQSNFVYNELEKVVIAPNGEKISIYNSQNGKLLYERKYGNEEFIISMHLSENCRDLYLHLNEQRKINIYLLDIETKQIILDKIIQLHTYCYNLTLCFDDDILILLNDVGFEFRFIDDDCSLIKQIQVIGTESFFFNRQHPKLNKFLSLRNSEIIVNEKKA